MTVIRSDPSSYSSDMSCIFGLLIKCPFGCRPLLECPLNSIRQTMGLEEKFHYAKKLSESDISLILQHHNKCFSKRSSTGTASLPSMAMVSKIRQTSKSLPKNNYIMKQ